MGKPRPPRRRDRRKGVSPYQRHEKVPFKYGTTTTLDAEMASRQMSPRRGRNHAGAWGNKITIDVKKS